MRDCVAHVLAGLISDATKNSLPARQSGMFLAENSPAQKNKIRRVAPPLVCDTKGSRPP